MECPYVLLPLANLFGYGLPTKSQTRINKFRRKLNPPRFSTRCHSEPIHYLSRFPPDQTSPILLDCKEEIVKLKHDNKPTRGESAPCVIKWTEADLALINTPTLIGKGFVSDRQILANKRSFSIIDLLTSPSNIIRPIRIDYSNPPLPKQLIPISNILSNSHSEPEIIDLEQIIYGSTSSNDVMSLRGSTSSNDVMSLRGSTSSNDVMSLRGSTSSKELDSPSNSVRNSVRQLLVEVIDSYRIKQMSSPELIIEPSLFDNSRMNDQNSDETRDMNLSARRTKVNQLLKTVDENSSTN